MDREVGNKSHVSLIRSGQLSLQKSTLFFTHCSMAAVTIYHV